MIARELKGREGEEVIRFWYFCRRCNQYIRKPQDLSAAHCWTCGLTYLRLFSMETWAWLGFWRRRVKEL